jgi:predicted nucleotidyltransferase
VRVFGSFARGDDRAASDLDLLVDMESDRSLLDLAVWPRISRPCCTGTSTS